MKTTAQIDQDITRIANHLSLAFCGASQWSEETLGMAIAGHFNNGGLLDAQAGAYIERAAICVCDRWEHLEMEAARAAIRIGFDKTRAALPSSNTAASGAVVNEDNSLYVLLYRELIGVAKMGAYKEHAEILTQYAEILATDPARQGVEVLGKALRFLQDLNRMGIK